MLSPLCYRRKHLSPVITQCSALLRPLGWAMGAGGFHQTYQVRKMCLHLAAVRLCHVPVTEPHRRVQRLLVYLLTYQQQLWLRSRGSHVFPQLNGGRLFPVVNETVSSVCQHLQAGEVVRAIALASG